MTILAINGGKKTRELPFPDHPIIGKEEKKQEMNTQKCNFHQATVLM